MSLFSATANRFAHPASAARDAACARGMSTTIITTGTGTTGCRGAFVRE